MSERRSGIVTFLFTDVQGSTGLLKKLGRERYGTLLADQQRLCREAFSAHQGEEIDTQGDSFFVAFHRASDAVSTAVAIERALADHDWPDGSEVRVRIGIHTGEADAAGERYVGFSVHRAARIGSVAHGGQILLSSSTRELVEDDLPAHVFLRDLGLYRLKDVDRPERLSQVAAEGLQARFPPLRAEKVKEPLLRRRSVLAAALVGVVAVAVAIPVLALSSGGGGASAAHASVGANAVAAVDASSNDIAGSAALQASPGAIAYGEGSVWTVMPNEDSVSRVDPATNTVQQTIGVGDGPSSVADGGGFVWVANSLDGTVSQIDPQKNGGQEVARIAVGNAPTGVAYGLGSAWVASSVDRTIRSIDPLTGAKGKAISVEAGADAIAVGDGAAWVTSKATGILSRVDLRGGGAPEPIHVGNSPVAVAVGPGAVWVTNNGDATVSRIDPVTRRVVATITVGEGPTGVAVAPGGTTVWVSNELAGTLTRIDAEANRPIESVALHDLPQGVAASDRTAFVSLKGVGQRHRGGTLTLAIVGDPGQNEPGPPSSLDPAHSWTASELLMLTNDGLVSFGRSGGADGTLIVPDLAAAQPTISDGGRTYTFQLRQDIRYSTGAVVQSADIRRGLERTLVLGGNDARGFYASIVGASACRANAAHCDLSRGIVADAASNTVTFHLVRPDPDFLYKLAFPWAFAVPASTPLAARVPLPATGPYKIAHFDAHSGTTELVRNPEFRVWSAAAQPDGYSDRIVERFGYTGEGAVRAVERGRADITAAAGEQLTPAFLGAVRSRFSSRLYPTQLPATVGLVFNVQRAPFNDVRVRRALNYALDRNHLIDLAGGPGFAEVACQLLPPNTDGYRPYCPYTVHPTSAGAYTGPDLAKARRLVAESGTKGQTVTVRFLPLPIGRRNGVYVVKVLRELGYDAHLKIVSGSVPTTGPNIQAGIGGWGVSYPSASAFFSPAFTCGGEENETGLCDRRIDAQIARARALQASDPARASELWTRIDRELTDEAPWATLRTELIPDLVSRRTGNYTYCYLAAQEFATAACLDQLWVR